MNIKKINPQLRSAYRVIPPLPFHNPIFLFAMKYMSGIQRKPKSTSDVIITKQALSHAEVRIYRPVGPESGAGLLWIHGGGYVIGKAAMNDRDCARYARELAVVVVSVDYRLAPEFPFPSAIDDCHEAWEWFLKNAADLGVAPDRIVISGQSAGGGLAAGLVQKIFDGGGVQPAGQSLIYPMLDDRTAARTELDAINHRTWHNKSNRCGWSSYLGQAPGLPNVEPYASPARRDDLSGLPPTWIGVGDIDLFYQENCEYGERLKQAGIDCVMKIVPGAPHGFEILAPKTPLASDFHASNEQFLRRVLVL